MFVGAYALSVSKSTQCIFSTGKRASDKLLELVQTLLKLIPGVEGRMKRRGEVLTIYGDDPGDLRTISSYPAASKTLRGKSTFCNSVSTFVSNFGLLSVYFRVYFRVQGVGGDVIYSK